MSTKLSNWHCLHFFIYVNQSSRFVNKTDKSILQHTCPICYESKLAFKKQHKNMPHHPPHLSCTVCDEIIEGIFAQYGQILCPICRTPDYKFYFSFYSPCHICHEMTISRQGDPQTIYFLSYRHVTDQKSKSSKNHPNQKFCSKCLPPSAKICPFCKIEHDFSDPWN